MLKNIAQVLDLVNDTACELRTLEMVDLDSFFPIGIVDLFHAFRRISLVNGKSRN